VEERGREAKKSQLIEVDVEEGQMELLKKNN
jgi:hypothetical protein